jgi:GT2 family glycosyltransferase
MTSQRVTALLVVHDGATWLPEVVTSLSSQSRGADRIVAIDTGSLDGSPKLLKGARIPTITLERDAGFGEAIARGVEQLPAMIDGVEEWLWILHDDCLFHPQALEALLAALTDRPNVVMAGPKLLGWHDKTHLLEVGISIASNGARWTGLEPAEYDQGQRDGVTEALSVSTAGALIRRDVFEELGGFDRNLELFRDDVDFGWRVRVAGHSVVAVSDAIGYHAQASATERRTIDVKGALLHRPLLLDRQNAAYVLLANSSFWTLPWIALQLLSGALVRALGYLLAKLPGYASDELLAIVSLIIKPAELIAARRDRKKHRLISSRVVQDFIPSRFTQLRSSIARNFERFREFAIPDNSSSNAPVASDLTINEDEDLLTPASQQSWKAVFTRPLVAAVTLLVAISLIWTRHRWGYLSGGTMAQSPHHFKDLFNLYLASWHEVGMGSGLSTPAWIPLLLLASLLTLGNVALFITIFFLAAPFILLLISQRFFARYTDNKWLSVGAGLLYALSPVSIAAINSGRIGVLLFLAILPYFVSALGRWVDIENQSWRGIFAYSLFIWLLFAFNPSVLLITGCAVAFSITKDFFTYEKNYRSPIFLERLKRRMTFILAPLLLSAPSSFSLFLHPTRLWGEIGFAVPGGGPTLAILANPGGAGSLPWWCISPITIILVVTYFSSTAARRFASLGLVLLLGGTFVSALVVHANGYSEPSRAFAGTFIAIATLLSITSAVVMFDKIRARLEESHLNFRHISIAAILAVTVAYSATSIFWLMTAGADSPLRTESKEILPAFLAIEKDAKTVVLRPYRHNGEIAISYYISRGHGIELGETEIAPTDTPEISRAIEGLVDNTGVTSSKVLAAYGIKYVFLKNPVDQKVVQTIDGLGGFNRTSSTNSGIVWRVIQDTGRLIYTDYAGKQRILISKGVRTYVPGPGTITLTETYSPAWQIMQDGYHLEKIRDIHGLPTFAVTTGGDISIYHDGRTRRAWISFFIITLVTCVVLALPAGRRKREISESVLA